MSERVKVYSVEVGVLRKVQVRVYKVRNNFAVLKQLTGFQTGRDINVDGFSALRYFPLRSWPFSEA